MTNLKFNILYDTDKILCFVGSSYINVTLFNYFQQYRPCELHRLEDIENNNQDWFDNRQFFTGTASIGLKKKIVDFLDQFGPDYFSVIGSSNQIGFNVTIGRGCFINEFNIVLDDVVIGNFVVITAYSALSHKVQIKDFCHIGPYVYCLFATLGQGSYVAARSNFLGKSTHNIETVDYCNYLIGSTVTKNIQLAGTYHGNRQLDNSTSLDRKID